jgi:hypothetical protein
MGGLQQMAIVTLCIFLAGLIFHAGQLTTRVGHLEREFEKQRVDLKADIGALSAMVRASIGERRSWRGDQS